MDTRPFNAQAVMASPEETFCFGKLLGKRIDAPLVIALTGELGAGKTCLAQGIAKGLGVPEDYYVTSPSYSLINEYPGRLPLYHIDLYRLSDVSELDDIGIDEILTSDAVSVIEWAEKLGAFSGERLHIHIEIVNASTRRLVVTSWGPRVEQLIQACLPRPCGAKQALRSNES